jgi:hypothetical protein
LDFQVEMLWPGGGKSDQREGTHLGDKTPIWMDRVPVPNKLISWSLGHSN